MGAKVGEISMEGTYFRGWDKVGTSPCHFPQWLVTSESLVDSVTAPQRHTDAASDAFRWYTAMRVFGRAARCCSIVFGNCNPLGPLSLLSTSLASSPHTSRLSAEKARHPGLAVLRVAAAAALRRRLAVPRVESPPPPTPASEVLPCSLCSNSIATDLPYWIITGKNISRPKNGEQKDIKKWLFKTAIV